MESEKLQFCINDTLIYELTHLYFSYNSYVNSKMYVEFNNQHSKGFNRNDSTLDNVNLAIRKTNFNVMREYFIEDFITKAFNLFDFYTNREKANIATPKNFVIDYEEYKLSLRQNNKLFDSRLRSKFIVHFTDERANNKINSERKKLFTQAGVKNQDEWFSCLCEELNRMTLHFIKHKNHIIDFDYLVNFLNYREKLGVTLEIDEEFNIKINTNKKKD